MRRFGWRLPSLIALASLLVACEDEGGSSSAGSTAATAGASAAAATASATTSASAKPAHPHAGTWKGTFEATKGEVTVEEGVPYGTWNKEDGKTVAGKGELELQVKPNGSVSGKTSGALGALDVMGVLQPDGELAVTLQPADPNAEDAMTGTLVGKVEGDLLETELRASSRDGDRVRKATVTLKRLR